MSLNNSNNILIVYFVNKKQFRTIEVGPSFIAKKCLTKKMPSKKKIIKIKP